MPRRKISSSTKSKIDVFQSLQNTFNENIIIRIPLSVIQKCRNLTQEEKMFSYNHLISTPTENTAQNYNARIDGNTDIGLGEEYHPFGIHNDTEAQISDQNTSEVLSMISTDTKLDERPVCMWCCHPFSNSKYHLPLQKKSEEYIVHGAFCSIQCAAAYNFHDIVEFGDVWERYSLLHALYCDGTSDTTISLAPSRLSLKLFGGELTIEEFRKNMNTKYHISLSPIKYIKTYSTGTSSVLQNVKKRNGLRSFQTNLNNRTPFTATSVKL